MVIIKGLSFLHKGGILLIEIGNPSTTETTMLALNKQSLSAVVHDIIWSPIPAISGSKRFPTTPSPLH